MAFHDHTSHHHPHNNNNNNQYPHQQQQQQHNHSNHHNHYHHHHQDQDHLQTLTQERRQGGGGGGRGRGASHRIPSSVSAGTWRTPKGAALLLVVLAVLSTAVPGCALCEDRCERVVPMLTHLRALWSRSFKRVGEKRVSFEEFMVSLVQASSNTGHSRAHRLGNALLNLIGQYQDCVMACEHPFSKRGADILPSKQSKPSLKHLCDRIHTNRLTSTLLGELCMTYGP